MRFPGPRRILAIAIVGAVLGSLAAIGTTVANFSSVTGNAGNDFQAAPVLCTGTTSQTITADTDTFVREDAATTNYGATPEMEVRPDDTARRRGLLSFALPTLPARCEVTSASLRLFATTAESGHSIETVRALGGWDGSTVTWNSRPSMVGPASDSAPATLGWMQWDVADVVQAIYDGEATGIYVRDAVDEAGTPTGDTRFKTLEAGTDAPELVFTFGLASSGGADTTAPWAEDVQSADGGGTVGLAQEGDSVSYTFSEPVDPASILAGWDGSPTSVVVHFETTGGFDDVLTVWGPSGTTQVALGTVETQADHVTADTTFGSTGNPSVMVMSGETVTVTFGTKDSRPVVLQNQPTTWRWIPSTAVTDLAGNPMFGGTVEEAPPFDPDL